MGDTSRMSFVIRSLSLAARPTMATLTKQPVRTFVDNVAFKRWVFNASGWNQFGLYHDDALQETPDVKEALTRVPQNILDERSFRIQRALHCSMLKTVLPKDQWPTYEEDREKGRYLQPYLKEVKAERARERLGVKKPRQAWTSNYCNIRMHYLI